MDIRQIMPGFAVAPQIEPTDMAALAALGITTVIDNRPDHEIPPAVQSDAMRAAAEAAGPEFVLLPADSRSMTLDLVEQQGAAIAASDGPVLAYCASGTRSSILWALSQAGTMPAEEIIEAAAQAGYDLSPYRAQIEALARQN